MSEQFHSMTPLYQVCSLEKSRQIVYPSAYDNVPEIQGIEKLICAIAGLLYGSIPQSAYRLSADYIFTKLVN